MRFAAVVPACIVLFATIPVAARAAATYDDIAPADRVTCPSRHDVPTSPVSDEQLTREYLGADILLNAAWDMPHTPTRVSDAATFPTAHGVRFQGHSGGSGAGQAVAYDPRTRILYRCAALGSVQAILVRRVDRVPPAYVPRVSVAPFASSAGLGIGSTLADVRRIYGSAARVRGKRGGVFVSYVRTTRLRQVNYPFIAQTVFELRAGRVVGFMRFSGV